MKPFAAEIALICEAEALELDQFADVADRAHRNGSRSPAVLEACGSRGQALYLRQLATRLRTEA